jgi:predicted RecA/RadA family phage recombinase
MPAEATFLRESGDNRLTADAAIVAGEVYQLKDGRAAVYAGLASAAIGDRVALQSEGKFTIAKLAGVVLLDGGRLFWDHSANVATFRKVNDRDFYLGRVVGDAASADTTCVVDLNVDPRYDIDLQRDPHLSVLVGTAAAGGFGYPVQLGGAHVLELTATNEAQKVDLLSVDGFAKGANAIVEGAFRVLSDGAGTVVDFSLGVASATHASDADQIAESVFAHLDANNTNIMLESDDGTTEVAATDSTLDYVEGVNVANRVEVWFDMRDPADVQIYVDGVLALGATVFNVNVAVGPLFLLVHLEKSISTDTYKIAVDWLRARYGQL